MPVTTPEKTVDNENAAEKAADDAEVDEKIMDDADSEAENVSKEKADAAGQDAPAKADKNMNLIQKTFRQNLQRVCGIFSPVFRENRMRVILSNR